MSLATPPKTTAVIHYLDRHRATQRDVVITVAVGSEVTYNRCAPASSDFEVLSRLIDAVNDTFAQAQAHAKADSDAGMILYIANATVRSLLRDTASTRPGLEVRSVITGPAMNATWQVCRSAHALALYGPPETCEHGKETPTFKSHRVYATDASKQKRDNLIGIAAVASTGYVKLDQVRASTVVEGEFAAIAMVAKQVKNSKTARVVDILTDSLTAARALNSTTVRSCSGDFEKRCLRELDNVRARGIDVRVSWVRGHNGNALNELADRAAVASRRCGQWEQSPAAQVRNIRADLNGLLKTNDLHDLVPATPLPAVAADAA